jgi:hypothetical protein
MRLAVNIIAFQIAWFACVLAGANGYPWIGIAVAGAGMALHLKQSLRPAQEALLLAATALIGAIWDGLLVGLGILVYPSGIFLPWVAPSWIIAMWASFATTFNVSLLWLRGRWYLAALFGGIGGPLAYYAGHKLGGVSFPEPAAAMAALATGWAVLMPLLLRLAERLNGEDHLVRFMRPSAQETRSRV